jgi:hypothetical protein
MTKPRKFEVARQRKQRHGRRYFEATQDGPETTGASGIKTGGTPTRGKQIQQNWRQPSHTQALSKCGNLPPPEDTHKENGNSRNETS